MASRLLKTLVKNIENKLRDMERRPSWLAEKSGVSKGMISRILNHTTNPTLDTIESIASALGVHPWNLIAIDGLDVINGQIQDLSDEVNVKESNLTSLKIELEDLSIENDLGTEERSAEISELINHIDAEQRRILVMREEIERLSSIIKKSKVSQNHKQSILDIQSRLTSLDESQLRRVDKFITDLLKSSPASSSSSDVG